MINKQRWGTVSKTIKENIDENAEQPKLKEKIHHHHGNMFKNDDAETEKFMLLANKINKIDIYQKGKFKRRKTMSHEIEDS